MWRSMKNDWKGDLFFSFSDASRSHTHEHSLQGDISAAISAPSIESFMYLNIYMQLNPNPPRSCLPLSVFGTPISVVGIDGSAWSL